MSMELCDVAVVGSGFGGAIPAYYAAAAGARVVILERGPHLSAADFTHDFQMAGLARLIDVIKGDGMTVLAGNCVGGGSVIYLAASLRAPSFTFERTGGTGRRLWPSAITRSTLDPYYERVEAALPVSQQSWNDVTYAGGVFAAACARAGHTANPVPVAVDLTRCTNCGWMLNGCRFDAKRSMLLNYLPAASAYGAQIRALHEIQLIGPAVTPGYRYSLTYSTVDASDYRVITGGGIIEAKQVVLGAGAVGTPVILRRSAATLGAIPAAVGSYFSGNGDRVSVAFVNENAVANTLGLHRTADRAYDAHHIGKAITAMTYDFLDGSQPEYQRFSLQQLAFPALANLLAAGPEWYGVSKKQRRAAWRSWLTVLAMTEDDNEGRFTVPPPTGSFLRIAQGAGIGTFTYRPTSATQSGFAAADVALKSIMERDALAATYPWTDVPGQTLTAHPLSSCRLGDDPATSALTPSHQLRGHPGLFVTDGSAVPAAITVNPALTIAALAERASTYLLADLRTLGVSDRTHIPIP